ncbi:MAG: hypothetical protein ACJA01_003015 [Saprospiraceae bacterium]
MEEEGVFSVTFQVKDYDTRSLGTSLNTIISIGDIKTYINGAAVNGALGDSIYPYSNILQSAGLVDKGRRVIFKSASAIELSIDFTIKTGGILEAYIEKCN